MVPIDKLAATVKEIARLPDIEGGSCQLKLVESPFHLRRFVPPARSALCVGLRSSCAGSAWSRLGLARCECVHVLCPLVSLAGCARRVGALALSFSEPFGLIQRLLGSVVYYANDEGVIELEKAKVCYLRFSLLLCAESRLCISVSLHFWS